MISKAKKGYLCHKIVNCGSSQEPFHLSSQMMGKFGDNIEGSGPEWCISSMIYSRDTPFWSETRDMLPTNISPDSLPGKFNEFFVRTN